MAPIPATPYDFSGYLADQLQESSGLAHGYSAQINSFRDELDAVDTMAETGYAPVLGGSALGAIGAALAGGSIGQIAGGAYGAGAEAYNNLEMMEKTKRENLQKEIASTEGLLKDQLNFSQSLVGSQNQYNMNRDLSYMRGEMPGTTPYGIETKDEITKAQQLYGVRNPAADPGVQGLVQDYTGVEFKPGTPITQLELAKQTKEAMRREADFQRKIGEKTPYGIGDLPQAPPLDSKGANFVRTTTGQANKILTVNIPNLRDSIEKGATIDQIKTDTMAMVEALKALRQQGANFTQLERELNISQLPTLLDANPGQLATYMADTIIRQQDPIGKLDRLAWTLEAETNALLQPYGRFMNKGEPLTRGGPTVQQTGDARKTRLEELRAKYGRK